MQNLRQPWTYWDRICMFNKISRLSVCTLKFDRHCYWLQHGKRCAVILDSGTKAVTSCRGAYLELQEPQNGPELCGPEAATINSMNHLDNFSSKPWVIFRANTFWLTLTEPRVCSSSLFLCSLLPLLLLGLLGWSWPLPEWSLLLPHTSGIHLCSSRQIIPGSTGEVRRGFQETQCYSPGPPEQRGGRASVSPFQAHTWAPSLANQNISQIRL